MSLPNNNRFVLGTKILKVNRSWPLFLSIGMVGLCACASQQKIDLPPTARPAAHVIFHVQPEPIKVTVEVADTDEKRSQGLMYRKHLEMGHGMLFVFPESSIQRFWMKNTYIPLDMIFVNEEYTVVGVLPDVESMTLAARSVDLPAKYVVEVPAGFSKTNQIDRGVHVGIHFY